MKNALLFALAAALISVCAAATNRPVPPPGYGYEGDLRPNHLVLTNGVQAGFADAAAVTNAARAVVNTIWDEKLGVAWEARMHNGALYYVAVTNRQEVAK